jgi:hypothetical protein
MGRDRGAGRAAAGRILDAGRWALLVLALLAVGYASRDGGERAAPIPTATAAPAGEPRRETAREQDAKWGEGRGSFGLKGRYGSGATVGAPTDPVPTVAGAAPRRPPSDEIVGGGG